MATKEEYTVRPGRREDMSGAHKLCLEQGWNISIDFLQFHFDLYPEGVFVAESPSGEILSHCAAVCLDDHNAFVAYYVTKHACRGQGIGRKVFDLSMEALGDRNVGLNSAWDRQKAYASGGFKISTYPLATHTTTIKDILVKENTTALNPAIRILPAKDVNFGDILEYDKKIHPMERVKAWEWLLRIARVALVTVDEQEKITGVGALYRAETGYRLMPLYSDTPEIAKALVIELVTQVAGEEGDSSVEVFFPSDNPDVKKVYGDLGMMAGEGFYSMRMFTQHDVPVPTHLAYSLFNYANVLI